MTAKRIIPCLDIKEGRVVKGVRFVNLRDAGDPVENARLYNSEGADELAFLDRKRNIFQNGDNVITNRYSVNLEHHIPRLNMP